MGRAFYLVCLAACTFQGNSAPLGGDGGTPIDAAIPLDVSVLHDVAANVPCATAGTTCTSATELETCPTVGAEPVDESCDWGCVPTGPAHCFVVDPSGGAVTNGDLQDPNHLLMPATMFLGSINGDTGEITAVRAAGTGVISGIDYKVVGNVAVFRFGSLAVDGPITLIGSHAIALVSIAGIAISASVDATSQCSGTTGGPGGNAGAASEMNAPGMGAGGGGHPDPTNSKAGGGGGGAFGGSGGNGGVSNNTHGGGGTTYGDQKITMLTGGGGGGGGAHAGLSGGGSGGGGGGGVQLVANQPITFGAFGQLDASGCGGTGEAFAGGGGGGAGGAILVEAPSITVSAVNFSTVLAVNGGGGGGAGLFAGNGQNGQLSQSRAGGGGGVAGGGQGAAVGNFGGAAGTDGDLSGGGGGGAGWLRLNTLTGQVSLGNANASPSVSTAVVNGQ